MWINRRLPRVPGGGTAVLAAMVCVSCADTRTDGDVAPAEDTEIGQRSDEIVNVGHTAVERQSIGNCWVYAGASWAESMHQRATGEDFDTSQSYWTYMHWFIQLTNPRSFPDEEMETGGNWSDIRTIVQRYGLMEESNFVQADTASEMSDAQAAALDRLNSEFGPGGALETDWARSDPGFVRMVLDWAWQLTPEQRTELDEAFGPDLSRTFARGTATMAGTNIMDPDEFAVSYTRGNGTEVESRNLSEAFREWRQVSYSSWSGRRTMQRLQRAMHAQEPVVMSWFVDFNALERDRRSPLYGSFNMDTLEAAGAPGSQGGHMVVVEDYQARVEVTDTELLAEWATEQAVPQGELVALDAGTAGWSVLAEGEVLDVTMAGSGDGDLYVRKGAAPTLERGGYDCRPYASGSAESCTISGPAEVFISIHGYSAADVTFQISKSLSETRSQVLQAGVTLDASDPEDDKLLSAALADATEIEFVRIKNSWGANRQGLPMASFTERGYHDLYMNYLDGMVANEDACPDGFDSESCVRNRRPMYYLVLPPGY